MSKAGVNPSLTLSALRIHASSATTDSTNHNRVAPQQLLLENICVSESTQRKLGLFGVRGHRQTRSAPSYTHLTARLHDRKRRQPSGSRTDTYARACVYTAVRVGAGAGERMLLKNKTKVLREQRI